ncbi:unnamed protein product [Polarella glacialis]|uniref:Reverse transcriptase domain-containing protein n=1 Tax=Polarella glacialis TaxID=89957 RepID=A0A813ETF4_POLGL|nr:unnamed protein product [Polarella glacialis]
MHVQLRQHAGLDTYLLFADLKAAFDIPNRDAMLVTCYLAGIVATEWFLLFDFFHMDCAVVVLAGYMSQVPKFRAAIPQGRKFSLHAFTAMLTLLRDAMTNAGTSACTILPCFAQDATSGAWEFLTVQPLTLSPDTPLSRGQAA